VVSAECRSTDTHIRRRVRQSGPAVLVLGGHVLCRAVGEGACGKPCFDITAAIENAALPNPDERRPAASSAPAERRPAIYMQQFAKLRVRKELTSGGICS